MQTVWLLVAVDMDPKSRLFSSYTRHTHTHTHTHTSYVEKDSEEQGEGDC